MGKTILSIGIITQYQNHVISVPDQLHTTNIHIIYVHIDILEVSYQRRGTPVDKIIFFLAINGHKWGMP